MSGEVAVNGQAALAVVSFIYANVLRQNDEKCFVKEDLDKGARVVQENGIPLLKEGLILCSVAVCRSRST